MCRLTIAENTKAAPVVGAGRGRLWVAVGIAMFVGGIDAGTYAYVGLPPLAGVVVTVAAIALAFLWVVRA